MEKVTELWPHRHRDRAFTLSICPLGVDLSALYLDAMQNLITVLAALALASPALASDAHIERGKALIAERLRDPESAQFRNVFVAKPHREFGTTVCGEMNAKNAMGGYVGFTRFIVEIDGQRRARAEEGHGRDTFHMTWSEVCRSSQTR